MLRLLPLVTLRTIVYLSHLLLRSVAGAPPLLARLPKLLHWRGPLRTHLYLAPPCLLHCQAVFSLSCLFYRLCWFSRTPIIINYLPHHTNNQSFQALMQPSTPPLVATAAKSGSKGALCTPHATPQNNVGA